MTLTLAVLGVVLGACSLGWQVWTFVRSGARVVVTASNVFPLTDGQQLGDWHIAVEAVNKGRAATTITGWGIRFPSGDNLVQIEPIAWSTPLPHRLEPESVASFHVLADTVRSECQSRGVRPGELRPWVQLASGKRVFGKSLPLAE